MNLCDADLIGRTLSEGRLKMHISKDFFGGELVEEEEALKIIKNSAMISLAGQKSVNIALANKLGSPQAVRENRRGTLPDDLQVLNREQACASPVTGPSLRVAAASEGPSASR